MPIVIATIGFTFLSEALRDALDPRGTTVRKKS
jgi:ABC-type dipeptide/oligopeptide/nickel transport system permease subunit